LILLSNNGGEVSTLVGLTQSEGFVDGIGSNARFKNPSNVAFSYLNPNILFVCDFYNHCIRMVNISNRDVVTICGNGKSGFKNGIGKESQFSFPKGLIVDYEDKIFVCDYCNHSIGIVKRISSSSTNTSTNNNSTSSDFEVSTLIGNGPQSKGNKDGDISIAQLNYPQGIIADKEGNLWITQKNLLGKLNVSSFSFRNRNDNASFFFISFFFFC